MKQILKMLTLGLAMVTVTATASASERAYKLVCGVAQGTPQNTYRTITEKSYLMKTAADGSQTAQSELRFKTDEGEVVILKAQAYVRTFAEIKQMVAAIMLDLKFTGSNKSVQAFSNGAPMTPDVSGDIESQAMPFSVGDKTSDFFKAGCKIQTLN